MIDVLITVVLPVLMVVVLMHLLMNIRSMVMNIVPVKSADITKAVVIAVSQIIQNIVLNPKRKNIKE